MAPTLVLLLSSVLLSADKDKPAPKAAPAAKVAVTAELACLHCTFGEGDGCAVCLKIDDKTPVLLEGAAAKKFFDQRLSKKVLTAQGALTLNKDKRMVLTSADAHAYTDQDKGKAPDKGQARVNGSACCGHCDLGLCDDCTLAVLNAKTPIVLDGKLAQKHEAESKEGKTVTATGKLFVDKRGLIRLDAGQVEFAKKK